MIAFDVETTGIDPRSARIVSAALVDVDLASGVSHHSWLLKPDREIEPKAAEVHGITNERAQAEGVYPREALPTICARLLEGLLTFPVVIYNARFDLTILYREALRHRVASAELLRDLYIVDPIVLDKKADPYRKGSRKLSAVCGHYGVKLDDAHEAGADALAAARLAYVIGKRYPRIGGLELSVLHGRQRKWAADQAASLEAYFAKKGKAQRVEGDWPLLDPGPAVEQTTLAL